VVSNSAALALLSVLLPEPAVASIGKGRKRKMWKPSVSESMTFFVDVQKVRMFVPCFQYNNLVSE